MASTALASRRLNPRESNVVRPTINTMLVRFIVRIIAFVAFLGAMLLGVFASAGVCAVVFGSRILDTALGDPPDRSHPAFYLFLALMIPAMLISACGGLFGIVVPLYRRFQIPLGKSNELLRQWLHQYALHLSEYTKPKI